MDDIFAVFYELSVGKAIGILSNLRRERTLLDYYEECERTLNPRPNGPTDSKIIEAFKGVIKDLHGNEITQFNEIVRNASLFWKIGKVSSSESSTQRAYTEHITEPMSRAINILFELNRQYSREKWKSANSFESVPAKLVTLYHMIYINVTNLRVNHQNGKESQQKPPFEVGSFIFSVEEYDIKGLDNRSALSIEWFTETPIMPMFQIPGPMQNPSEAVFESQMKTWFKSLFNMMNCTYSEHDTVGEGVNGSTPKFPDYVAKKGDKIVFSGDFKSKGLVGFYDHTNKSHKAILVQMLRYMSTTKSAVSFLTTPQEHTQIEFHSREQSDLEVEPNIGHSQLVIKTFDYLASLSATITEIFWEMLHSRDFEQLSEDETRELDSLIEVLCNDKCEGSNAEDPEDSMNRNTERSNNNDDEGSKDINVQESQQDVGEGFEEAPSDRIKDANDNVNDTSSEETQMRIVGTKRKKSGSVKNKKTSLAKKKRK